MNLNYSFLLFHCGLMAGVYNRFLILFLSQGRYGIVEVTSSGQPSYRLEEKGTLAAHALFQAIYKFKSQISIRRLILE